MQQWAQAIIKYKEFPVFNMIVSAAHDKEMHVAKALYLKLA